MQMRCSLVVRLVAALGVAAAAWTGGAGNTGAAAATAAQDPPAGRSAPGGPTPARPDQDAWRSANRLTDPAARLAALRKILTDFPETALALQIDNAILTVLTTTYPDRVDDIARQMEKVLSHTPASAEPHDRLFAIQGVVTQLADRVSEKALLDRAAELHAAAIAALDEARYIAAQRALAAKQGSEARSEERLRDDVAQVRARASQILGRLHRARGDMAAAEREFRAAVAVNPGLTLSVFALAEIEETRGNERAALDYYLQGAATGRGTAASYEALDRLFRKVHGDARSLDDAIDEVYRVKFPNPVKHEPYTRPAGRTDRLVLVEMFTGSACPPCVAADLALEGVLARYPADAIVALAYHANIPQPDPMVVSGGVARLGYYDVDGVPAFYVDGVVQDNGGGTIERAAESYRAYVSILDKALETPSAARVRLGATTDGKKVMVTARASSAQSPGARLHLVLVERELRFSGQNGVRFHPMVVRAVAGDKASGYALKPEGDTTVEHTFDLTAIAADVRTTLEDEIARRRKSAHGGAAARNWRVEGNALDAIDPRDLTVVAFVQAADKTVLQAARADVRTEPSSGASRD